MWFKFPPGAERVSVHQQEFSVEAEDHQGRGYFRAPDHFAPSILSLGGFVVVDTPPEGAPADLPKADPLRDNAIAQLTANQNALKIEIQNLRTDLGTAAAKVRTLENEKAMLAEQLRKTLDQLAALQQDDEEGEAETPPSTPALKAVVGGKGK